MSGAVAIFELNCDFYRSGPSNYIAIKELTRSILVMRTGHDGLSKGVGGEIAHQNYMLSGMKLESTLPLPCSTSKSMPTSLSTSAL